MQLATALEKCHSAKDAEHLLIAAHIQ